MLFALLATPLQAGADDGITIQVVSADDSTFPDMTLVLSLEANGRPLPDLTASDVTVTDNGASTTVTGVSHIQDASIPTDVVLTLDTSGSMQGEKLASAKQALAGLVGRLAPSDSVALVTFSDSARLAAPLSTDKAPVTAANSGLQATGNTALYEAVAESAQLAPTSSAARRLVILLTDGEEFGDVSGPSRQQSLDQAAQSGTIFYVIGVGAADRDYLTQLAAMTGGRYLDAATPADVQAGYASIEQTLKGQFVLSLKTSAPAAPLSRTLVINVNSGGLSGSYKYTYQSKRVLPVPTPAPAAAATVQPAPAPSASSVKAAGGSSSLWLKTVIPALALVVVMAGGVVWRIRKRRRRSPATSAPPEPPSPPATVLVEDTPSARLTPQDASLECLVVPTIPMTIGWASDCEVRLHKIEGLAGVHARLWWRDGKVMVHHLGHGATTTINGAEIQWASLTDGDIVAFGPYAYTVAST